MKMEIDDALIVEGIARGVERAIGDGVRAEFRAFLEDYFGCLDKAEIAAFLGCSERTVLELWQKSVIPKDTLLGEKMSRAWLPALKELLAKSRIKSREQGPRLKALKAAA